MRSTESRFVIGPSIILFACVYVCTFQPGNFTGWAVKGLIVAEGVMAEGVMAEGVMAEGLMAEGG